jgi:nicotinamide-nucleotide amidase
VADWEEALAEQGIHIAYLPAPGQVRVRLSATGDDAKLLVDRAYSEFLSLAGDHVVAEEDKPLAQVLVEALTKSGATVATAESCTGGTIASRITAISGSSAVFQGGVVAYANEVKCRLLGVSEDDLQAHGAVSEPVVRQMATGARERFGTTYALATSGIAGPTGGTAEKPVGTIWIALASEKGTQTRLLQLGHHRGRNIDRTVLECLAWLVRALKEQNSQRS